MPCYVDDAPLSPNYGRMKLCHMIADTHDELIDMVDRLGLRRSDIQQAGTYREHFDISKGKRERAIEFGAIAITRTELGKRLHDKRAEMGDA